MVLEQGVVPGETRVTCTACAGTLLLEFGLLSRLTGDPTYEVKALFAARQIYGALDTHAATAVLKSLRRNKSQGRCTTVATHDLLSTVSPTFPA
jgi:hypothetical protein